MFVIPKKCDYSDTTSFTLGCIQSMRVVVIIKMPGICIWECLMTTC